MGYQFITRVMLWAKFKETTTDLRASKVKKDIRFVKSEGDLLGGI